VNGLDALISLDQIKIVQLISMVESKHIFLNLTLAHLFNKSIFYFASFHRMGSK
jgi:hypothetical protein